MTGNQSRIVIACGIGFISSIGFIALLALIQLIIWLDQNGHTWSVAGVVAVIIGIVVGIYAYKTMKADLE